MMEEYRKEHAQQLTDAQVVENASEQKEKHAEVERTTHKKSGIIVKGLDGCGSSISECCSPVPETRSSDS